MMVTAELLPLRIWGSLEAMLMVRGESKNGRAKSMVSWPVVLLDWLMALRKLPGPESASVVTVKTARARRSSRHSAVAMPCRAWRREWYFIVALRMDVHPRQ